MASLRASGCLALSKNQFQPENYRNAAPWTEKERSQTPSKAEFSYWVDSVVKSGNKSDTENRHDARRGGT